MKKFLLISLALLITQTPTFAIGTKNTMDKIMNSWLGENLSTVIECWGYPSEEKTIAGRKLYYWNLSSYVVTGGQYGIYGGTVTCNRILEVDENQNIIKWQWNGNSCPATYTTSKAWVNRNNNPWKKHKNK